MKAMAYIIGLSACFCGGSLTGVAISDAPPIIPMWVYAASAWASGTIPLHIRIYVR